MSMRKLVTKQKQKKCQDATNKLPSSVEKIYKLRLSNGALMRKGLHPLTRFQLLKYVSLNQRDCDTVLLL